MDINNIFDNIPEAPEADEIFAYVSDQLKTDESNSSSNEKNIDYKSNSSEWETVSVVESIITESTEHEYEKEISQIVNNNLNSCALIDYIDGDIKKCNATNKFRGLWQLIGTWQLDTDTVKQAEGQLENLGVCYSHFMFDQNKLHSEGIKKNKNISQSFISHRRCLYCGNNFYIFNRGKCCFEHSWTLVGKNLQIACISQKTCPTLQVFNPIIIQSHSFTHSRYVCCKCYENFDRHLYIHPEKGRKSVNCITEGKHNQDVSNSLLLFSTWITQVANSNDIKLSP